MQISTQELIASTKPWTIDWNWFWCVHVTPATYTDPSPDQEPQWVFGIQMLQDNPICKGDHTCLMFNVIPCLLLYPELFILLYLFSVSGLADFSWAACNTTCLTTPRVTKTLKKEIAIHSRSRGHWSNKQMPRSKSGVQKERDVITEPVKSSSQNEKREVSRSCYTLAWVKLRLVNIKVLSHKFSNTANLVPP